MSSQYHIIDSLIERYPQLYYIREDLYKAGRMLADTAMNKSKVLICGNGGSASDADHIVGELMKSFVKARPISSELFESIKKIDNSIGADIASQLQDGIPAIALTQHSALSSAFGNDVNPQLVFSQQVAVLGKKDDLFWAISTSGNSKNVVYAALTAKAKGLRILGLTGANGGQLKKYCEICIQVPEEETYKIQELHLPIYHALCLLGEDILW